MEFAIVAAKVIAGYMIISGLFILLRGKTFVMIMKDFFKHPAVVYLSAVILVFLGLMVVINNNVWDGTWRTWVTIFGVLMLLKGVVYVFFPRAFANFPYGKLAVWLKPIGLVMIVAGGYLWCIS